MTEINRGRIVRDRLMGEYGFIEMDRIGQIRRVVDDQHALIFEDGQWHRGSAGGYRLIDPSLKVARRDVNELRALVCDDGWDSWGATFDVTREISVEWLDRPDGWPKISAFAGTEAQVGPWLESWMPRFLEEGPRMPLLYTILERAKINPNKVGAGLWQLQMTAMLDGWTDEDEEVYCLSPERNLRSRDDVDEEIREAALARIAKTRAWVAEHPNGIERELMG